MNQEERTTKANTLEANCQPKRFSRCRRNDDARAIGYWAKTERTNEVQVAVHLVTIVRRRIHRVTQNRAPEFARLTRATR